MTATTTTAPELKGFFDRCVAIAERKREAREDFAEIKLEDPLKKIDWTRLMALAAAYDADRHDDKKHDRVDTLIKKAEYANWYAEILKIGDPEQKAQIRSSEPVAKLNKRATAAPARSPTPLEPPPRGAEAPIEPPNRGSEVTDAPRRAAAPPVTTPNSEPAAPTAPQPSGDGEPEAGLAPAASGSTNSDTDPLNCIPPELDRRGELRA